MNTLHSYLMFYQQISTESRSYDGYQMMNVFKAQSSPTAVCEPQEAPSVSVVSRSMCVGTLAQGGDEELLQIDQIVHIGNKQETQTHCEEFTTVGLEPDMYGQIHAVETPELIRSKLDDFDAEVKLRTEQNEDFHCACLVQAMEKCPELLTDEFKLQFLRCEVFNTKLAVKRYCKYWEERVRVCGKKGAFEPQTLDNLSPEDIAALHDGMLQLVCGVTDPMGRAILYLRPERKDLTKYTRTNILRACAYVINAALESETAQQQGAVILFDTQSTKFSSFDLKLDKMLITGIQGKMPMRLSAVHVCHPQSFVRIILPLIKVFMPERMRKRIQYHKGSDEEVLKSLDVYGLDRCVVPTELGGNVEVDHLGWLKERRARGL